MTADALLLVVVSVCVGFALGYVTAWRFARKLERHDVTLAAWDRPYDVQDDEPTESLELHRESQR